MNNDIPKSGWVKKRIEARKSDIEKIAEYLGCNGPELYREIYDFLEWDYTELIAKTREEERRRITEVVMQKMVEYANKGHFGPNLAIALAFKDLLSALDKETK